LNPDGRDVGGEKKIMSDSRIAVLDNGSGLTKIGYATDNLPTACFPTLVGRPMMRAGVAGATAMVIGGAGATAETPASVVPELRDIMVGDETVGVRHLLDLSFPIQRGIVRSDDDAIRVWRRALVDKLGLDETVLSRTRLSISEPPFMFKKAREKKF
jgi:actin-related protein 2